VTAHPRSVLLCLLLAAASSLGAVACGPPPEAKSAMNEQATRWLERAKGSYARADLEDARDAIQSALTQAADSGEVKTWAGRIYLARLEWAEAARVLAGVNTPEAHGLKGRAHWYAGELEQAADELDAVLADPQTKDEWAKAISRLARQGQARKPFQITGGLLAPVQMQRIRSAHMIVPVDINGEPALALVATGKGEVILDSSTRKEPSWVQLRFAERVEVSDVPALVEDLSGISKEVGAPIKALLGVNLLRRLNITFDFQGEQFVVRTREPPPPPKATRVALSYALGGAMVTRATLKQGSSEATPLLVNTLLPYPLALDDKGLHIAGVDLATLQPVQGAPGMKAGRVPFIRLGAFDLPDVPGFYGPNFADIQAATGMDIQGAIGAGMLALFRCTLTDGGKALWIEDPDQVIQMLQQTPPPGGPGPGPGGPGPGGAPGPLPGPGGPAPGTGPGPAPGPGQPGAPAPLPPGTGPMRPPPAGGQPAPAPAPRNPAR
jgi:hypothetical protein